MKANPFDTIAHWLSKQHMTPSEKREMRDVLMNYATTHPVKSGLLSPYTFRYIGVAFASLVIVLSGSIGLTQASLSSLPNQSLYGIKLWVEEFQASSQKTPEARIAFENNRIATRFHEATQLAVRHELNDATSQVIQAGLEHSRESVRATAESIQSSQPELALQAINNLETSFSSNARILATIEKNTNQNIGTIVLAAQQSTAKIALEKTKFEQILALQPNALTKDGAEQKLSAVTEALKSLPQSTQKVATDVVAPVEEAPILLAKEGASKEVTPEGLTPTAAPMAAVSAMSKSQLTQSSTSASTTKAAPAASPTADELVAGAVAKINQGAYSEALVALQKAQQVIDEQMLTQRLETTYQIKAQ